MELHVTVLVLTDGRAACRVEIQGDTRSPIAFDLLRVDGDHASTPRFDTAKAIIFGLQFFQSAFGAQKKLAPKGGKGVAQHHRMPMLAPKIKS
jgi:hypothetical protein